MAPLISLALLGSGFLPSTFFIILLCHAHPQSLNLPNSFKSTQPIAIGGGQTVRMQYVIKAASVRFLPFFCFGWLVFYAACALIKYSFASRIELSLETAWLLYTTTPVLLFVYCGCFFFLLLLLVVSL